jgi:hypothetical protein
MMHCSAFSYSSSKRHEKAEASSSDTKRPKPDPDDPFSKLSLKPSVPTAKRGKSLPRHLPSPPLQTTEVKAVRKPITRPMPDTRLPLDFRQAGGKREAAELKLNTLGKIENDPFLGGWLMRKIDRDPQYQDLLRSMHPRIASYTPAQKSKAYDDLANIHPRLIADTAGGRNRLYGLPNYPTSSRMMKPAEQEFLTQAMLVIKDEVEEHPFHIHGESGVVGNKNGDITDFMHNSSGSVNLASAPGDKYALHSHPPFGKPFDFSASEADHRISAESYLEYGNKMKEYLTNGRDVAHIRPDSMEMVKLVPDRRVEENIGNFPEAFRLPEPQQPPRPFPNHEALPTFREGWAFPPGWTPPEDYPRG